MGDGEYITPGHRVLRGDEWVPASDVWPTQVHFSGKVYNLHVENEHNYVLKNGAILHNYNKL
jgi:intein/homing endonuclease